MLCWTGVGGLVWPLTALDRVCLIHQHSPELLLGTHYRKFLSSVAEKGNASISATTAPIIVAEVHYQYSKITPTRITRR